MKKRFTVRRSVGLTQRMAERVEQVSRAERWSFEQALRVLVLEALRSRESLSAPGAQSDSNRPAQMNHFPEDDRGPGNGDLAS